MGQYTIALAGNPNTGKSTIFNALTGANQHTGNWPGKTVERKEGLWKWNGDVFRLVDLPGAYSLSAFSLEEVITRDFILDKHPDLVVVVADATNLERNLYLVIQILEMTSSVILALNMQDVAKNQGIDFDLEVLSGRLGIAVVPMAARRGEGMELLKKTIAQTAAAHGSRSSNIKMLVDYGEDIQRAIDDLQELIVQHESLSQRYPPRWLALKLLEKDDDCLAKVANTVTAQAILARANELIQQLEEKFDEEIDTVIADRRYCWIHNLIQDTVHLRDPHRLSLTDRIDRVATHPVGGLVLFFGMMWMVFKLSTDVATPYVNWVNDFFTGSFAQVIDLTLSLFRLNDTWIASLINDGILAGIGGVLVFVPVLMFLYLGLALLEDSGYMARAAFVMDRYMRRLGLHGKSFVPLILGFGCNVPAVYATRTLENEKDRLLTGLLIPFMSCGARLPVYVLIATIFFPRYRSLVILSMYFLGVLIGILVGLILRKSLFQQKDDTGLLMELPSYRLPSLPNVWREMVLRTKTFWQGAAKIIIWVSVIIWLLMAIPVQGEGHFTKTDVEDSVFAIVANTLTPIFKPLGFGNWQMSSALLSGLVAKEVIISTSAQVYHVDNSQEETPSPSLSAALQSSVRGFIHATWDTVKALPTLIGIHFGEEDTSANTTGLAIAVRQSFEKTSQGHGALAGLAFMVFVLLYTPCAATIAAQRQEFGVRWAATSVGLQVSIAWLAALVVFQGGLRLF
ncbi:MAG: ferrous iron transport protein B [Chloroflexi bacterium]|nr:ferrous iron transport protein B [Chloroflexota bacterium]